MPVSDIEANNLLEKVTKFHCGVIYDYRDGEYHSYRPGDFGEYLDALEAEVKRGGLIVFHNGHKYDVPALEKLAKLQLNRDFKLPRENCIDTLVLSRLLHANLRHRHGASSFRETTRSPLRVSRSGGMGLSLGRDERRVQGRLQGYAGRAGRRIC